MEHLLFHECERFALRGIECPFRKMTREERKRQRERDKEQPEKEAEEREGIRAMIPARRQDDKRHKMTREQAMAKRLADMPVIAHGEPQVRKALERMRQIQNEGGLPSIPRESTRRGFPLPELEGRGLISTLAAIAIFEGLRQLRATGSGTSSQAVRASEMRAAEGLSRLSQSGKPGSRGGFGGLHTQPPKLRPLRTSPKVSQEEDDALRRLLGFSLGPPAGPGSGSDVFSETGF